MKLVKDCSPDPIELRSGAQTATQKKAYIELRRGGQTATKNMDVWMDGEWMDGWIFYHSDIHGDHQVDAACMHLSHHSEKPSPFPTPNVTS